MKYYIAVNGRHEGPYEVEQLKNLNITPDTYVWCEGMTDWKPASEVEEVRVAMIANASVQTPPPFSGATVPPACPSTPSFQAQSASQMQPTTTPKTWLVESILVTLLCCLPFGIVAIIKASDVNSAIARGDYAAAAVASKEAGKWTKIGFWCGVAVMILYLLYAIMLFAIGGMAALSEI